MLTVASIGDAPTLKEMLRLEGIANADMHIDDYLTLVLRSDDGKVEGFFTIRTDTLFMHLIHFCLERDKRNIKNALRLVHALEGFIQMTGHKKFIIHSEKEYLDKLIGWYFKVKPYAVSGGARYYLVGV